ncbi:hypothetical protein [Corynebacterium phoceense]
MPTNDYKYRVRRMYVCDDGLAGIFSSAFSREKTSRYVYRITDHVSRFIADFPAHDWPSAINLAQQRALANTRAWAALTKEVLEP